MHFEHAPHQKPVSTNMEIDTLAKKGFLKSGDTPGEDTYDDGMDEHGRLTQGSTVTGSGGTYREDTGPLDLTKRPAQESLSATSDGLNVVDDPDVEAAAAEVNTDIYSEKDAAERWLRANDPSHPQYKRKSA